MALADMPYNFEEVVFVETQRICAAPCFQGEHHSQPESQKKVQKGH